MTYVNKGCVTDFLLLLFEHLFVFTVVLRIHMDEITILNSALSNSLCEVFYLPSLEEELKELEIFGRLEQTDVLV